MRVTKSAVHEAIFQTLRQLKMAAGDRVELSQLKYQWFQTGFREADLIDGLASLCSAGSLTYVDSGNGFIGIPKDTSRSTTNSNFRNLLRRLPGAMNNAFLRGAAKIRPRSGLQAHERRKDSGYNGNT